MLKRLTSWFSSVGLSRSHNATPARMQSAQESRMTLDEYVYLEGSEWHERLQDIERSLRSVHLAIFLLKRPISESLSNTARTIEAAARFRSFLELFDTLTRLLDACIRLGPELKFCDDDIRYPWDSLPNNPSALELAISLIDSSAEAVRLFGEENLGDLPRAAPLLSRVKTEAIRILGREDKAALWVLVKLGDIYMDQNQLDDAQVEIMAVADVMSSREDLDLNHCFWKSLVRLINKSGVHIWDGARDLLSKALRQMEESSGPEYPDTVGVMRALGKIYWRRNKLDESETMLRSALEIVESNERLMDKQEVLETMNRLVRVYIKQANWAAAESLMGRMIEKAKVEPGEGSDRWLCQCERQMGEIYLKCGRWREAESTFTSGLITCSWRIWEDVLLHQLASRRPWDNLRVQFTQGLAHALFQQNRTQEAQSLLLSSGLLDIDPGSTDYWVAIHNTARLCIEHKNWAQAEAVLVPQVERLKGWCLAGPDHAQTLYWVGELAKVFIHRQRWAEAANVLEDLVPRLERLRGIKNEDTLRNIESLRMVYRKLKRWADDQQLGFKVLRTRDI